MPAFILTRRRFLACSFAVLAIGLLARTLVLADAPAPAAAPISTGQRVFVAGHSFHVYIARELEILAESAGIKGHRTVGVSFIGGSRVIQHWDIPDAQNKTKDALLTGKVDVLTLSPITIPDEGIENFARLALAHNPAVRITVQESWLPNDEPIENVFPLKLHEKIDRNTATIAKLRELHEPYFKKIDAYVSDLNTRLGKTAVFIVPCGHALLTLREKIINGEMPAIKKQSDLFFDAFGHPMPPLQALVTYCHFAVIYRQSPVGLKLPKNLSANGYGDEKLNRLLEEIAWDAVIHEPLSGVSESPTTKP